MLVSLHVYMYMHVDFDIFLCAGARQRIRKSCFPAETFLFFINDGKIQGRCRLISESCEVDPDCIPGTQHFNL